MKLTIAEEPTADALVSAPSSRFTNWLPVTTMLVVTLVGTLLPVLRTKVFYYWDDTAGVAVGVWQRIPESILSGQSPFLQLDMWRGGNFIAEAATGMWNPVMLGLMLGTYPIDDVAVAITAAKIVLFLITAGGVYLLARGYGANAWMSAVAGVVLPLSGWSIFMDGTSWINGTAIMAFTPWAWWALRRAYLRGFRRWDIVLAIVLGYLVPSTGNPYGVLTLAVVFLAIAVEALLARRAAALKWLIPIGASTVLLVVVVYLPFVLTSAYGVRAASGIWNDEFLAVNMSDILGLSAPTLRPYIKMFAGPMEFPGTYLAWFILPLLPWLRWRGLGDAWRPLSSALTFGVFFLAFVLGPSQLGMFRWPARLIPFVYLAVLVVFAVLATRGMERSRPVLRASLSGVLILVGAWIAYSDVPGAWKWHGLVTLLIAGGIFVIIRWTGFRRSGAIVMIAGMVVFLAPQLMLTASNQNVADYRMPSSKSEMKETFADRSDGLVVQVFDINVLVGNHPEPERWQDLLAGNMPSVAGVSSTTGYTGIGFNAFDNALCLTYNGGTCPDAWDALWQKPKGSDAILADLIGAKYVVVAKGYTNDRRVPDGWTRTESTDIVNVYTRDGEALPFGGTLSVVGDAVDVSADDQVGPTGETATVSTSSGDTTLTFARIAWPGYTVTVDGEPIPTEIGPAGLLTVTLPEGLTDAEIGVSFTPPGLWAGLAAAAVGALGAVALVVFAGRTPRMSQKAERRPQGALS